MMFYTSPSLAPPQIIFMRNISRNFLFADIWKSVFQRGAIIEFQFSIFEHLSISLLHFLILPVIYIFRYPKKLQLFICRVCSVKFLTNRQSINKTANDLRATNYIIVFSQREPRGRSFSLENSGACLKRGVNEKGWMPKEEIPPGISLTGTGRTKWIGESARRSGSEGLYGPSLVLQSAQALSASFSGLTSRRVPARGKRKKEQLRSRREMVRLKCGERAQWRTALRENDFISVGMIIAPLQLQSSVNCVLSEGLHYS